METDIIFGHCFGCDAKIPYDEFLENNGLCEECDTPLMREFLRKEYEYLNERDDVVC